MSKKKNKMNSASKNAAKTRRNLWIAIAVLTVLLCLLIAAAVWLSGSHSDGPDASEPPVPVETTENVPESTAQSTEAEPLETEPTETESGDTEPSETKPAETKPGNTKPGNTKPGNTKPGNTKPTETKPAETKPAETKPAETKPAETEPEATEPAATEPQETVPTLENVLGHDVEILDIGSYTGQFMEDGTDEIVSGILMLKIVNNGEEAIQYAEITMDYGGQTARFSVSTLLPGATMILLEQNRMAYSADVEPANLTMQNVAVFSEALSRCEDKLKIQILDGAINVSNISGKDIAGEVRIFYKNYVDGIYYGGITYVVRIQQGIKADQIKQIMASHFSASDSVIMFITCG